MRPAILNPLFASVETMPGIGPKMAGLLDKLLVPSGVERHANVGDLLFHLPTGVIDRRARPLVSQAQDGTLATLRVRVDRHSAPQPGNRRAPYRVHASDGTGELQIVFFNMGAKTAETILPVGEERLVSGRIEIYRDSVQIVHPDYVVPLEQEADLPAVEPVYPMTAGLTGKPLRKAVAAALKELPDLPEWQDAAWLKKQGWPSFDAALRRTHAPEAPTDVGTDTIDRRRLGFDEALAGQLSLALVRQQMRRPRGRALAGDGSLGAKVEAALPFSLTNAQRSALADIHGDLQSDKRMLRLLQGDVGSGKTVVALLAMATAVEAGYQAVMMAPTEILARQHFETLRPLCVAAGIEIACLTGRDKGRERQGIELGLADGSIQLVVGTHALFQSSVAFRKLGLAVVDEQHRFGVHQRLALSAKGEGVDLLVMTATPIPRTLVLTHFGDMDVSLLREKPAGRKPIDTRTASVERLEEVVEGLDRAVFNGQRIYWVCPLVEESNMLDVSAAEARHTMLARRFGDRVALVHGRMKPAEKDAAVARFASGQAVVLVATTVIEVGVDVPKATIMVIEHAERFGLAQLHQLRGRVGRGSEKSTCLLLYKSPLGETARKRLETLRETEDGFIIAEADLDLRGEGDVLGTRQSGGAVSRIGNAEIKPEYIEAARDDARLILGRDPRLASERGEALRILLYLFEKDQAVRLLEAG